MKEPLAFLISHDALAAAAASFVLRGSKIPTVKVHVCALSKKAPKDQGFRKLAPVLLTAPACGSAGLVFKLSNAGHTSTQPRLEFTSARIFQTPSGKLPGILGAMPI